MANSSFPEAQVIFPRVSGQGHPLEESTTSPTGGGQHTFPKAQTTSSLDGNSCSTPRAAIAYYSGCERLSTTHARIMTPFGSFLVTPKAKTKP
ncbi:unnamed protein product [Lupinus luteus]|uniref:Uncharacterized protein n=1 Tax=Lupinus luteus TaxID=3873 RepID=A0AAV1WL45_LUPLU